MIKHIYFATTGVYITNNIKTRQTEGERERERDGGTGRERERENAPMPVTDWLGFVLQ